MARDLFSARKYNGLMTIMSVFFIIFHFIVSAPASAASLDLGAIRNQAASNPIEARALLQAGFDGGASGARLPVEFPGRACNLPAVPDAVPAPLPDIAAVPAPPLPKQTGTLALIQIDGLSYARLQEAFSKGHAKNMARLLNERGYRNSSYLCGMPTVTMSVQSQLFFGKQLPGNEWYSKAKGKEVTGAVIEEEIPRSAGLLYGGRAYLSELSGGADKGVNVRVWLDKDIEESGTALGVVKELDRSFPHLLTGMRFPLYTFIKNWRAMKRDFAARKYETRTDRLAPLYISMLTNFGAAVAADGISDAIRDSLPSVYADFSGFDEKAHYYGYSSEEAFAELDKIDGHIGKIIKSADKHGARVLIFSDHGQTPSETFVGKFGGTPQSLVDGLGRAAATGYKDGDMVFGHVYSMGNVYVKSAPGRLDAAEIEKKYPGFAEKLAAHPGIGVAAVRNGGAIELLSKNGRGFIGADGSYNAGEGDPLGRYADGTATREALAAQVKDYLSLEESGDLVVMAPYENGRTIDYNIKYTLISEHGGIGGEQMHPFVIYHPAAATMDPASFRSALDFGAALRGMLK